MSNGNFEGRPIAELHGNTYDLKDTLDIIQQIRNKYYLMRKSSENGIYFNQYDLDSQTIQNQTYYLRSRVVEGSQELSLTKEPNGTDLYTDIEGFEITTGLAIGNKITLYSRRYFVDVLMWETWETFSVGDLLETCKLLPTLTKTPSPKTIDDTTAPGMSGGTVAIIVILVILCIIIANFLVVFFVFGPFGDRQPSKTDSAKKTKETSKTPKRQ